MTQNKAGTHGIKATSRAVRVPLENGQVIEINPKTNIIWLWDMNPFEGDSKILFAKHINSVERGD